MSNALKQPIVTEVQTQEFADTTTDSKTESRNIASNFLGLSFSALVFSVISGKIALWDLDGVILASSLRMPALLSALLGATCILSLLVSRTRFSPISFLYGSAFGLVLLFCSDWLCRSYSLLKGPSIRGEIFLCIALAAFGIKTIGSKAFCCLALPTSLIITLYNFSSTAKARLILGDDHSVFLHRLSLLKDNFPHIPAYDASWNGGLDCLHVFATGVLNLFFLFAPIVYFTKIENSYSVLVVLTLFGLVPLCSYFATRLFKLPVEVACLSAIVSITQSLFFYRWGLVYGTMGFITSCALLPLVFALFCRFLNNPKEFSPKYSFLLFASCGLMLCWPLSGIPFVIIACFLAYNFKDVLKNKSFLIACISVVLVTAPWVYVLWSGWNVKSFIAAKKPAAHSLEMNKEREFKGTVFRAKKRELSLHEAITISRDAASPTNPLLLLLAIPGMLLLSKKNSILFLSTTAWLIAVALIGGPLKPQLELERMLVMLACISAIPTAQAINEILKVKNRKSILNTSIALLCLGFLLAGVLSTAGMLANRRHERIHFAKPSFYQLAAIINKHTGDGRAFFSGFTLHELNEGHLAPLSHFVDKPMVARSHVHNVWQYRDVIPQEFRAQGEHGIETYLDLWNVSLVLAHDPVWRRYFRRNPNRYTEVGTASSFVAFRRVPFPNNYFLSGNGEISSQSTSGITLTTEVENPLIKFKFNKFLKAKGCSGIDPHPISGNLEFIQLSGCETDRTIRISTTGFLERVKGGLYALGSKIIRIAQ